jgi:hypothetical protein
MKSHKICQSLENPFHNLAHGQYQNMKKVQNFLIKLKINILINILFPSSLLSYIVIKIYDGNIKLPS